jgi:hypothetical protein
MKQSDYLEICKFIQGVWGREMSAEAQKRGYALLKDLPAEAVGEAVTAIANEGGDRIPAWPLVAKTARSIWDATRERQPQLPAGDTLSDLEHIGAMVALNARATTEQRRRAARVTGETKNLPMRVRIKLASTLLGGAEGRITDPAAWDRVFDQIVQGAHVAEGALPL